MPPLPRQDDSAPTTMGSPREFTMDEVAKKSAPNKRGIPAPNDLWVVIDGDVYDVTNWVHKHPGGRRVISVVAGEDATDQFHAFHPDLDMVRKYLKPIKIGSVKHYKPSPVQQDFRELRAAAVEKGCFKPSLLFYAAHFASIVLMFGLAVMCFTHLVEPLGFWTAFALANVLLATGQAQAGWLQHDFGHLSVFKSSKLCHFAHFIVISLMKGASSDWWNYRHFLHHAKPNVVQKDPDIEVPYFFLVGDKIPKEWGEKKKGFMPYNYQSLYFHLFGPMLLLPLYFPYENLKFIWKRKDYVDFGFMVGFFGWWFMVFGPLIGGWGALGLYFSMRCIESHWFTWVTQMSHLPMDVDYDQRRDWVNLQLNGTCNVEPGTFNDWFTGHLNYQIEHHLFPTMPRHNYYMVKPLVESLCKKHNIAYEEKTLLGAFNDVLVTLKKSGQIWFDAYYHL